MLGIRFTTPDITHTYKLIVIWSYKFRGYGRDEIGVGLLKTSFAYDVKSVLCLRENIVTANTNRLLDIQTYRRTQVPLLINSSFGELFVYIRNVVHTYILDKVLRYIIIIIYFCNVA